MSLKRKITVYTLAAIAFIALFLLPLLGLSAETTQAVATDQAATSSGDYIFYIVENNNVPLAAVPSADASVYVFWVTLAAFGLMLLFVYSTWYLSVRKNLGELSGRLSPVERRTYNIPYGFLHPVRSYRLEKEAEDIVVSRYSNYI